MRDRGVELAAGSVAGAVALVVGALLFVPETYGSIDVGAATPWSAELGILTPTAALSGVGPRALSIGWILGCTIFALLHGASASLRRPARAAPDAHWIFVAVVAGGALARVIAASVLPLDPDTRVYEVGPYTPTFSSDHDTWVHPPAFRAVQLAWLELVGGSLRSPPLVFHGPSLLFALLGLFFVARSAREVGGARAAAAALVAFAWSPDVVADTVLARPYSLATALFGVVLFAWARGGRTTRLMVVAAGLCAWVDVPFGVAALVCCALAGHESSVARVRAVALVRSARRT